MYEFQWQLPEPQPATITLRLHSRHDWFGIKTLQVDGRLIYRRFWLSGIEHRFFSHTDGRRLDLRLLAEEQGQWRPALYVDGTELPEQLSKPAPYVPHRPAAIGIVTGLTYLLLLVAVAMLLSITDMLEALKQRHADRKYVLTVRDPQLPDMLTLEPVDIVAVPQGESLTRQLRATGGEPPYRWSASRQRWPKGMTLTADTGEVSFTPRNPNDYLAEFTVTDARGDLAPGALAVVVQAAEPPPVGWPTVTTVALPPAVYGEPYEACLQVDREYPDWGWSRLSGALPRGLKVTPEGCVSGTPVRRELALLPRQHVAALRAGKIKPALAADLLNAKVRLGKALQILPADGDPDVRLLTDEARRLVLHMESNGVRVLDGADQYGLTVTVVDAQYSPGDDLRPWIIPFLATAISLLGYWNMRRWGVMLLGGLVAVQVVLLAVTSVPIEVVGVVGQGLIWVVGLAYYRQMH